MYSYYHIQLYTCAYQNKARLYRYIYRFYNENVNGIVKKRFSAKVFIVKSVVKSEPSRMYVLEELLEQQQPSMLGQQQKRQSKKTKKAEFEGRCHLSACHPPATEAQYYCIAQLNSAAAVIAPPPPLHRFNATTLRPKPL